MGRPRGKERRDDQRGKERWIMPLLITQALTVTVTPLYLISNKQLKKTFVWLRTLKERRHMGWGFSDAAPTATGDVVLR